MTRTMKTMTQTLRKQLGLALSVIGAAAFTFGSTASAGEYYVPASAPVTYKMTNPQTMGFAPQSYTVAGQTYTTQLDTTYDMVGSVSWYGDKFHGKKTASHELFDKNAMTAAHKTLPLNSIVKVTNLSTGQSVDVRINDRGPFVGNRLIDLSEAAAEAVGFIANGASDVRVQYVGMAQAHIQPTYVPSAPQSAPVQQFAQNAAPMMMPQTTLPGQQVAIPDANPLTGQDPESVVMTIKGAVHMASSRSTDAQPRFIPAVNRVTYRTK